MTKPKILIASVLKPLKDTRAYYRLGLSLRETNKYAINIIGFSTKKEEEEENLKLTPLYTQSRTSWKRWLSHFTFFKILFQEKPQLCIIGTWELLPAVSLAKTFLGFKVIYDVQENYIWNIKYNQTLPPLSKFFAIQTIRMVEYFSRRYVEHYIFSEHCYISEKRRLRPFSVLENRFYGDLQPAHPVRFAPEQSLNLLISGTITEVYGIMEAMIWFIEVQKQYPSLSLKVIGHCPIKKYKGELMAMAKNKPGLFLEIEDTPVSYERVLDAYQHADVILMPYYQIPSIKDKIPSKLYEALALGKVCLISPNTFWESLVYPYPAGFSVDFDDLDQALSSFEKVFQQTFFQNPPQKEVLWAYQEDKFLKLITDTLGSESK